MRVLLRFAIGFVAAAVLALTLTMLPGWLLPVLGALMLCPGIALCLRYRGAGPILLGLAVGLLWTSGFLFLENIRTIRPAENPVAITGTATDYSVPTTYGIKVPARISDGARTARAMVWINTGQPLEPGDSFAVTAALKDPGTYSNYYRSEGIRLLAYGKQPAEITKAESLQLRYLPRWIAHCLEQSLAGAVPADALGYATALTTGNRDLLSGLEKGNLKTSGIYHVMALSGMHLAALVGTVSLLTRRRRLRAFIGIPLCLAFAVITGGSATIVRAAVLQIMLLLAPLVKREEDGPTSMGLAALLLTAQNPWCLFGWGTQLSFVSMAGILLLSDRIRGWLCGEGSPARKRGGRLQKVWIVIASSLSATAAAMAFSVPLTMAYFGYVSLVGPLTNLLAGWAVTWCFRGSLFTALFGLVSPAAGRALGWCLAWPIRYVQWVAGCLARVPFAALNTESVYGTGWVVLTYGIILACCLIPGKKRRVIPVCCVLTGLAGCLFFTVLQSQSFSLTVLDVGQGQSLIASARGQTVMVDCGGSPGEAVGDLAADRLAQMGEARVDALVLTHYDSDHTSGLRELFDRVQVDRMLVPEIEAEREKQEEITELARAAGVEVLFVTDPSWIRFGGGTLRIFPPVLDGGDNTGLSVLINIGEYGVLVTGDMGGDEEQILMKQQDLGTVDVLVAGHHGSRYSTSEELLQEVEPQIVVISVGGNSYGHPAEETLDRIAAVHAEVFRTDHNGTICVRCG